MSTKLKGLVVDAENEKEEFHVGNPRKEMKMAQQERSQNSMRIRWSSVPRSKAD